MLVNVILSPLFSCRQFFSYPYLNGQAYDALAIHLEAEFACQGSPNH